jgi:hypothetical protein
MWYQKTKANVGYVRCTKKSRTTVHVIAMNSEWTTKANILPQSLPNWFGKEHVWQLSQSMAYLGRRASQDYLHT